jgi:hypothetical protein
MDGLLSESLVDLARNQWSVWIGLGGRFASEWVAPTNGHKKTTTSALPRQKLLEQRIELVRLLQIHHMPAALQNRELRIRKPLRKSSGSPRSRADQE